MIKTELTTKILKESENQQKHRQSLENAIIGAVVLESDALVKVIDIIDHKSFSGLRKNIWETIVQLWQDSQPVDMITVTHRLLSQDPEKNWAWEICQATAGVNSAANIRTHAIKLLEINISVIFLNLYQTCEADSYLVAIAEDILCALHTDEDKLQVIEDAYLWLENTMPDADITEKMKRLFQVIISKARKIQQGEKIRTMLLQIENLVSGKARPEIRELADAFVLAVNKPKLSTELVNTIFRLKSMINE